MFIIFLSFPFDNDFFIRKQAGLSSCLPLLRRCMQTLFLSVMAMSAAGTAGTAVAAASFAFFFVFAQFIDCGSDHCHKYRAHEQCSHVPHSFLFTLLLLLFW